MSCDKDLCSSSGVGTLTFSLRTKFQNLLKLLEITARKWALTFFGARPTIREVCPTSRDTKASSFSAVGNGLSRRLVSIVLSTFLRYLMRGSTDQSAFTCPCLGTSRPKGSAFIGAFGIASSQFCKARISASAPASKAAFVC